jgi:hypothetical protein
MPRRIGKSNVLGSKRFLATAAVSVVLTACALAYVAGINPVRVLVHGWSEMEDKPSAGESLTPKTRAEGTRYAEAGDRSAGKRVRGSGKKSDRSLFRRLFGRLAALFTRGGNSERAASPEPPDTEAFEGVDAGGVSGAGSEGRSARYYGDRRGGSGAEAGSAAGVDSSEFGVGPVGLGLLGNGGPIGAAGTLPGKALAPDPANDPYFSPEMEIPEVKPVRAAVPADAALGAVSVSGIAEEEGADGAANAATSGMRIGANASGPGSVGPIQDTAADYSKQSTDDGAWAEKKGGADLKKHKVKMPEVGGGKSIRNAPSKTFRR